MLYCRELTKGQLFAALTVLIVGTLVSVIICKEESKKSFGGQIFRNRNLSVWMTVRHKKQSAICVRAGDVP